MTLAELIRPLKERGEVLKVSGNVAMDVSAVSDDSRRIPPDAVFVAVRGERVDGHDYVSQAVAAGAAAVVAEEPPAIRDVRVPAIVVRNSRRVLGELAARLLGEPSAALRMIGVTGTNGKTTTTYLSKVLLEAAGHQVGLIGTVVYQIGKETIAASHTTPGAVELQALLSKMRRAGLDSAVMEVSSHALALDRTAGCEYDVAIFTNLTQDHLDFHGTMEEYFKAKLRLFAGLSASGAKTNKRAILNVDDSWTDRIREACRVPVWTYGIRQPADLRAQDVRLSVAGTAFTAVTPHGSFPVESRLVGEHNVYNILGAIGVGLNEGLSPAQIQEGIARVHNVPGRFERVEAGQNFSVVVDYAHTDDALSRLLSAAQALRTGRIITVFGCGGDRDRGKRPKMGRVAVERSDVVILTSDNPRTEDPMVILKEVEVGVLEGLKHRPVPYRLIADRRAAIESAVREARPGDMVLIAGKGHEDYQIIGTTKHHFDDREVAREAILHVLGR